MYRQEDAAKRRAPAVDRSTKAMKRTLTIIFTVIMLTGSSSALSFINISVRHTNATDLIYVNDRAIDEAHFTSAMNKVGALDSNQFVLLQIEQNVPTSFAFRLIKIIRDSGMKKITIVPIDAGYDLALSFASPSNTIDLSQEWLLEHTTAVKTKHDTQHENKEVEQPLSPTRDKGKILP
jgi:hypothetical protein